MAPLLAGDAALQDAAQLAQEGPYLTAHIYPESAGRGLRGELIALAQPHRAIAIDPARTPKLASLLAQQPLLAALDGKRTGHALMATGLPLPQRWACATVTHALVQADVCMESSVAALCDAYGVERGPQDGGALDTFLADAVAIAQIVRAQGRRIAALQLGAASRIEAAAVGPITLMEHHGMPVDRQRLSACLQQESREIEALGGALGQALGAPITAAAPDAALLAALSARGHALPSLGERNIRTLPHPLGDTLLRFCTLRRLQLTLGERFAKHIGADGRIHSHFIQIGARSGRMACTRPNLQAISADPGRRRCFVAPPGQVLVMGDYAACELRILADMSQDAALVAAIASGTDLHGAIAQTMFNTEVSRTVRPELRQMAKTIAFGLIYGMGPKALGAALNQAPQAATELTERFFSAFPKVRDFLSAQSAEAVNRGEARTLSGRRLLLPPQSYDRSTLLRMARNLPIQGTSADIIKVALARVQGALAHTPGRSLLHCIHDEIIVMCPQAEQADACRQLEQAMAGAGADLLRQVPLVAQIRAQADWQAH